MNDLQAPPLQRMNGEHPWELLQRWRGEAVIVNYDREADAWIFIAIHSSLLGPAAGGTRMKCYDDPAAALADALDLAEAMTYKYAAANFPRGGAKAVIAISPAFNQANRAAFLRRYGKLIRQLGGLFRTGPDVGTSSDDMDVIAETGAPYIHALTPKAGGKGSSSPPTALGVFYAMEATAKFLFGDASLGGRRVLVQGAGGVGGNLIGRLLDAGAKVIFSDENEVAIKHFRDELGVEFVSPESAFDAPCDIFSPCALGGVLNRETIARLRCRAVVGAANRQLAEPGDLQRLEDRGVLYAPDFVVNVGGAMAITGMESMGWSEAEAKEHLGGIRDTLQRVYELARTEKLSTDAAARRIADENLERARQG